MAAERPTVHCSTEGLSRPEVIVLLVQAFRSLNWGVEHLHPMRVVAKTPPTGFAKGEDVVIEFVQEGFTALSKPSEWSPFAKKRRHQVNLEKLLAAFAAARTSVVPELMASELKELEESGVMQQDASTSHDNEFHWKDIGTFFIPRRDFFATPLLLDISVVVYILMVATGVHFMEPSTDDLLAWGANWRSITLAGEWWRLLTSCFVHIGILHLLLNMYALVMIGVHLEPLLGRWRVLALYALTGIGASMTSLWWHDSTVSAGASGAIFGLYGVFLALLTTNLIHKDVHQQLLSSIGIFVVYNLVYGMKGGIDNAAHIGGLVSGLLFGFALYPSLRSPENKGLSTGGILLPSLALVATGGFLLRSLPGDDGAYQAAVDRFSRWEEQGLEMYRMEQPSAERQLIVLETRSMPAWDSAWAEVERMRVMDLSAPLQEHRYDLEHYARLRIENVQLVHRALLGEQGLDAAIDQSFARIDSVLAEM
jgi:rhomboid protease GluP